MNYLDGVLGEIVLLLSGLLLTRLQAFYLSTVMTFSIVRMFMELGNLHIFMYIFRITPSHASLVLVALIYFIVALSTACDSNVICMGIRCFCFWSSSFWFGLSTERLLRYICTGTTGNLKLLS